MEVARVLVVSKTAAAELILDYLVPAQLNVPVGSIVRMPLGSRVTEGVVLAKPVQPAVSDLKEIISVYPRVLLPEFLDLTSWLAVRAGCSMATALSAMLPPSGSGLLPSRWQLNEQAAAAVSFTEKQQLAVDYMRGQSPLTKSEIARALGISAAPIDRLIAKKVLMPVQNQPPEYTWDIPPVKNLTQDQERVLAEIAAGKGDQQPGETFLLHGVTSSGKTEVYIRLAGRVLAAGRQVMVLTPEIALAAQMVARFRAAFPEAAVYHSGLSSNQRAAEWDRMARGEVSLVIGTRSAVFAPLANLGLIVMDEEQELAYKQEENPRYHARDVARFRARHQGAVLVLGSATPALETYRRALVGGDRLLEMPRRVHNQQPIKREIIDMRQELQMGNRSMLSRSLTEALLATLEKKEQALLFLNRRGVAPTVLCRNCGYRYTCPNCSTALTLHGEGLLRCHYCGTAARVAKACPSCGSQYLRELGVGTQKLEAYLTARFPGVHVCRVDRDTAGTAQAKEARLSEFYRRQSGILLGTQMIAKGLDFPKVTLVGIVLADLSLALSDLRAAERTFQLITQAGGRSGRAQSPGRVIIQTYQPEHYSLRYALAEDYKGFYRREIALREKAGLPPFSHMTRILISAKLRDALTAQVEHITSLLGRENFEVLFSGPPPLEKLKGQWRWHFLLRQGLEGNPWARVEKLRQEIGVHKNNRCIIDNNPYNFM